MQAVGKYIEQKIWSEDNFRAGFKFTVGYLDLAGSPKSITTWAKRTLRVPVLLYIKLIAAVIFNNIGANVKMHIDYMAAGSDRPAEHPYTRENIFKRIPKIREGKFFKPHAINASKVKTIPRPKASRAVVKRNVDKFSAYLADPAHVWIPDANTIEKDDGHEMDDFDKAVDALGLRSAKRARVADKEAETRATGKQPQQKDAQKNVAQQKKPQGKQPQKRKPKK